MPAATTYPVQRLFYLDTEVDVVAIRNAALGAQKVGKTIVEVQSRGGQMTQYTLTMPVAQVLVECNAALKHINPRRYGRRVTRTYGRLA